MTDPDNWTVDPRWLHSANDCVGVVHNSNGDRDEGRTVTLNVGGERVQMKPHIARALAMQLNDKADLADGGDHD